MWNDGYISLYYIFYFQWVVVSIGVLPIVLFVTLHYAWLMRIRACYITYRDFSDAIKKKYPSGNSKIKLIDVELINALIEASIEVENGMHFSQFIVPAIQGGAGTSINMNINEIIANRALQISGRKAGSYSYIDPILHANICQSTNDVIPTSLKTTVLRLLLQLEQLVDNARRLMENHERNSGKYLRTAYTQMQEAVPSSYGQLFIQLEI